MVRATVRPQPFGGALARGLRLTAYYHNDRVMRGADRNRFIASAWLEQRRYNAGFDYMTRADEACADGRPRQVRRLLSLRDSVLPGKGERVRGPGAVRLRSGQTAARHQKPGRTARLPAWRIGFAAGNATAAVLLDFEQVRFKNYVTPQPTQERIILHGLINF